VHWVIEYRILVLWVAFIILGLALLSGMDALGFHLTPTGVCLPLGDSSMTGAGC
jgi:hypothetical protein